MWALVKDSGYRTDGSMKFGFQMNWKNRKEFIRDAVFTKIKEIENYDIKDLKQEEKIIPQSIQSLTEILVLCKERNITVIGLIPPQPTSILQIFESKGSLYTQSQMNLENQIVEVFSHEKAKIFNLSNVSLIGGNDNEFFDSKHGTDLLYARAFLYMALQDSSLKEYIDVKMLQKMIKNAKGNFLDNQ